MDDTAKKQIVPDQIDEEIDVQDDEATVKLIEQNQDLTDKWKRAVADYHNLERQMRKERSELLQFATANVLLRFLPIIDNLEQAVQGMSDQEKKSGWAVGVSMTVKQFKDMVKDEGMEEIKAEGTEFDAHKMEAIDTIEGEENKVITVLKTGYQMGDKVVRPAQVVIGKKSNSK